MFPTIGLIYTNNLPRELFLDFQRIVESDGLGLQIEEREQSGPYAGIEWLLPTAVIVFIGKAYFDGFLKEMGKDHYGAFKNGLRSLHGKFIGPKAPEITLVSTAGKVKGERLYSHVLSLLAEGNNGLKFKLLLQDAMTDQDFGQAVTLFISFLEKYHERRLDQAIISEIENTRVVGKTVLLAFSPASGRLHAVDPIPDQVDESGN